MLKHKHILYNWVEVTVKTHRNPQQVLELLNFRANYIICYSANPQCRADKTRGSGLKVRHTFICRVGFVFICLIIAGWQQEELPMQWSLTPMSGKGWNFLGLTSRRRQGKVRANGKCCAHHLSLRRIPSLCLKMRHLYPPFVTFFTLNSTLRYICRCVRD
jgi:hypothetical protein